MPTTKVSGAFPWLVSALKFKVRTPCSRSPLGDQARETTGKVENLVKVARTEHLRTAALVPQTGKRGTRAWKSGNGRGESDDLHLLVCSGLDHDGV